MQHLLTREIPGDYIELAMDVWTEPFWKAGKESKVVVARCGHCGHFRMPPTPFCPQCNSQEIDWVQQPNHGNLYSYTIVSRSPFPGLVEDFTYVPAILELPEAPGVRLIGNAVGMDANDLRIDMELEIFWGPVRNGWKVPLFRLPGTDGP